MGPLFLGAPVWACKAWIGRYWPEATRPHKLLAAYSRHFNTVEGNSTFYGLPSLATARRWAEEAAPGFRFCLKFPRDISHRGNFALTRRETVEFQRVLDLLTRAGVAGPAFLQLPPGFSAGELPALEGYLDQLSPEFPFAVEPRHRSWFDAGPHEGALQEALHRRQISWALFDSRALYSLPPRDDMEATAQTRKPRTPWRTTTTTNTPFLRWVGRNRSEETEPWLRDWATQIAIWIAEGKEPYVFVHAPDDALAPPLAHLFHTLIREAAPQLPALPNFPLDGPASPDPAPRQLGLFSG